MTASVSKNLRLSVVIFSMERIGNLAFVRKTLYAYALAESPTKDTGQDSS